ncbi:Xaa-Pro dipeptidyl-peptidase [Lentilactobacillus sp. Marseille-Q4993]|uniref:Xaa-Pro dipeptidyl-peptidase n=1 Tax=Lentilactobacillus sp. Marseille-Q4993 TaxID=3039492 RepID=UPI0024BCDE93|nr:Xaa-Pro dipeptidyl-peptidase [Lentilactobacillus sp. Marseille-Q4993]
MKLNQFAYIPTPHGKIVAELKSIHFITDQDISDLSTKQLLHNLLDRFFVEAKTPTTKRAKLAKLLATPTMNALDYLNEPGPLSRPAFNNISLQLLGFTEGLNFSATDPETTITNSGLPEFLPQVEPDVNQLIDAWYRLLNTRTTFGEVLIDYLASKGYYHQFDDLKIPTIFNGKTQAIADTTKLIWEVVYVEAPLDSDNDGKRDLLKVNIIRPSETETGTKVPTVFTADPYGEGMNVDWSLKMAHDNKRPLKRKQPNQLTYEDVKADDTPKSVPSPREVHGYSSEAEESFQKEWMYTLNEFLLARGYAVVYSSGVGTKDSDGFRTTGTDAETISATSVIEWLHGDRTAFTNKTEQIEIKAWWSNGNVGMTGRSYLGTLQNASALTGVDGLKACVVEAGLSNYYDYYRENGLMMAPDGDDADSLAEWTFSRQQEAGDYLTVKDHWQQHLAQMKIDQAHDSGSYSRFWDERNLLRKNHAKADMLLVHGLNDWNVRPGQVWKMREALKTRPGTQKLILHQGQHEYLNNFRSFDFSDIVNLWFTNKLFGFENHVNEWLPEVIVQDNAKPETWYPTSDWGGDEAKPKTLNLESDFTNSGNQSSFSDKLAEDTFNLYDKEIEKWRTDLYSITGSPMDGHCLRLLTNPLENDLTIDGLPQITLTAKSNQNIGMLSVALVDYGTDKRLVEVPSVLDSQTIFLGYHWQKDDLKEFTLQKKTTDFKRFSEAHINMQHRENSYKVDELEPNHDYKLTFDLQPTFWRIKKGHQLGVVIYATDFYCTIKGNQGIEYEVNLAESELRFRKFDN